MNVLLNKNVQSPYTIAAILVTNNRLELLKEAVTAVKSQALLPQHIVIVDNQSTDGTAEWLDEQKGLHVIHQQNIGGSGGFFTGIQVAVTLGVDWVWVMDDDTICQKNTLQVLVQRLIEVNEEVGFIGSKCLWKDGTPHLMNLPAIMPSFNKKWSFNKFDEKKLLLIETNSFVSIMINVEAIKKVGLPYKEFFIWGDDQEYTRRITKAGYFGFYCMDSVVLHKTGVNYFPDFYRDSVPNLWKHSYGFRNEFFMVKKNRGFVFFIFWLIAKVAYTSIKLLRIRKDNQLKFLAVLLNSAGRSILFNPKIVNV